MILKTHNKELPFIKEGWTGNQLTDKGRYTNLQGDDIKGFKDIWCWMANPRPLTKLKKRQTSLELQTKKRQNYMYH